MTNKPFSRRTKFVSQKRWLYKAGSRENTKIFLRGDTLRKWCITRPVGRVRIETFQAVDQMALEPRITRPVGRVRIETYYQGTSDAIARASPGRLAGCGLKQR